MSDLTSEWALAKAAGCARQAEDAFDDDARVMFELLHDRWISFANRFELEDVL